MDVREKLVELLGADTCKHDCCEDCEYCEDRDACIAYLKNSMADHLIAHGVTVQEWISVKDRLPESGKEAVMIALRWGEVDIGWCEDEKWGSELVNEYEDGEVTHWMPMPQPPKGE